MRMADMTMPEGFRQPPFDIDSEQRVLGSILINNDGYRKISHLLRPAHFYEPVHARIYAKIATMIEAGQLADDYTVRFAFQSDPDVPKFDEGSYFSRMARASETIMNLPDYARQLVDLATRRQVIAVAEAAVNRAYDPGSDAADEQLALLERGLEEIRDTEAWEENAFAGLDVVSISEAPRPVRKWIIDEQIPEGYLSLVAGDAGIGKSLLLQQTATHIALGRTWLGNKCKRCKVMLFAAEDAADELTIRQQDINADMGVTGEDLRGWLDLVPRADFDNLLVRYPGDIGETTAVYRQLEQYIAKTRPGVLIADNILQLMGGDSNKAEQVIYFCSRMMRFKRKYGVTIILVGHVPKNNAAIGYFGSIAWRAFIRAHLLLKKHDTEKGVRTLILHKSNYSEADEDGINLRWEKGVLRPDDDRLMSYGEKLERRMRESEVESIFLKALDYACSIKFSLSHANRKTTVYAPQFIVDRGMNGDATLPELESAMRRLENRDVIRRQQELPWNRAGSRHPAVGIARV